MLNRAAILLRYKAPAVKWINEAGPVGQDGELLTGGVNSERTVYLISDQAADDEASLRRWIRQNFRKRFEAELVDWYTDPSLWPKNLTLKLFHEWFDVECHGVLIDMEDTEIQDDEA